MGVCEKFTKLDAHIFHWLKGKTFERIIAKIPNGVSDIKKVYRLKTGSAINFYTYCIEYAKVWGLELPETFLCNQ